MTKEAGKKCIVDAEIFQENLSDLMTEVDLITLLLFIFVVNSKRFQNNNNKVRLTKAGITEFTNRYNILMYPNLQSTLKTSPNITNGSLAYWINAAKNK